jgi:hypothetical protein
MRVRNTEVKLSLFVDDREPRKSQRTERTTPNYFSIGPG